jgi:hypothetical protein
MNVHTCPTREVAAMNMWLDILKCADARFRSLDSSVNLDGEMASRKLASGLMSTWRNRIHLR